MSDLRDHDGDDLINIIEQAARQEEIAGTALADADDPEPARERIRSCVGMARDVEALAKNPHLTDDAQRAFLWLLERAALREKLAKGLDALRKT